MSWTELIYRQKWEDNLVTLYIYIILKWIGCIQSRVVIHVIQWLQLVAYFLYGYSKSGVPKSYHGWVFVTLRVGINKSLSLIRFGSVVLYLVWLKSIQSIGCDRLPTSCMDIDFLGFRYSDNACPDGR